MNAHEFSKKAEEGSVFVQLRMIFIAAALMLSCNPQKSKGSLVVQALENGVYEIYRTTGDSSLHFVSSELGHFNTTMDLEPGSYLVLADCSFEQVVIHPHDLVKLNVQTVRFIPPTLPDPKDVFNVQCLRNEMTGAKQAFSGQYTFNVLPGKRELLVGMVPLSLDLHKDHEVLGSYEDIPLASLKVGPPQVGGDPYFVSPVSNLLSITQQVLTGNRVFLLPGSYKVSMNGTQKTLDLGPLSQDEIVTAGLIFKTSDDVDANLHQNIMGEPFLVQLNNRYKLELNRIFATLPGRSDFQLAQSHKKYSVELKEGEVAQVDLKSVIVHSGCSPWEWECLGKKKIYLFQKDSPSPFCESLMDMPIFFVEDDVAISIASSKGIQAALPANKRDHDFYVGSVLVTPVPVHTPGLMTDLVRFEPLSGQNMGGYSRDIYAESEIRFTLLTGSYNLAQYVGLTTSAAAEGDRIRKDLAVAIVKGIEKRVRYPHYVSDQKARSLSEKQAGIVVGEEKTKPKLRLYGRF